MSKTLAILLTAVETARIALATIAECQAILSRGTEPSDAELEALRKRNNAALAGFHDATVKRP